MSGQHVLSTHVREQQTQLKDLILKVLDLAEKAHDTTGPAILRERLKSLDSAALFVVVGEVKSGKSSFLNALLGEDICEVAPDPCTSVIQELAYGEERTQTTLGDHWERLRLPKEVLKHITIVDTPGTNSIIKKHQTITENYLPQSDLVIFVFPAKNPHTATAWDLLSLIRSEWHRKIVFILQQADLASQRELAINIDSVKQYAHERNVQNPVVFTLSAKREMEGASDSGFGEFREYLRKAVENGDVWRMKFEGARDTCATVLSANLDRLTSEYAAVAEDQAFYEGLLVKLAARRDKANSLRRMIVETLCGTYSRVTGNLERDFGEGLKVMTLIRRSLPFVRDKSIKTWLDDLQRSFEKQASDEIDRDAALASKDLIEEVQAVIDQLSQDVRHREEQSRQDFSRFAADRTALLTRLRETLHGLRLVDIVGERGLPGSDLGALTLAGGGLAALGAVIAFATQLAMFDITGGIIASLGATLVVVTLWLKRGGIQKEVSQKLVRSQQNFRERLDREVSGMLDKLFHEFEHILREPMGRLDAQSGNLAALIEAARGVQEEIKAL